MELNQKEVRDSFRWLICAGGIAVAFSVTLYLTDNWMEGSTARDRAHNEQLKELRQAQAGVPARATDDRQLLPLTIEGQEAAAETDSHDHH